MKTAYNNTLLIVLLAALTSVGSLSIDTYLPALPEVGKSFGVGIEKVEITISIFLIFFALGQLVGGGMSDRVGRKKTSVIGLLGFSLTSFALFLTNSLEELYLYRALEAFTGGIAIVNASAMVRDLFSGKESAKVYATIGGVMMIAPIIAPAIGAIIISFYTWNYVFLFLSLYALLVIVMILWKLPETGSKTTTKLFQAYKKVLTHKQAVGYILAISLGFSGMFIFIEKSTFIYMEYFEVTIALFPIMFGGSSLMTVVLTMLNIKLLKNHKPQTLLKIGLYLQLFSALALVITSKTPNIYIVFIFITIHMGALGLIFGNGISCALEYFKQDSGVANSIIGVAEFTVAGVIGFLASLVHTGELTPIFIMMSGTVLLGILALRLTKPTS